VLAVVVEGPDRNLEMACLLAVPQAAAEGEMARVAVVRDESGEYRRLLPIHQPQARQYSEGRRRQVARKKAWARLKSQAVSLMMKLDGTRSIRCLPRETAIEPRLVARKR
jgi:hypothetical protein